MEPKRSSGRLGNRASAGVALVAAALLYAPLAFAAAPTDSGKPGQATEKAPEVRTSTAILNKIYDNANARLGRGDVAGAAGAFQTIADLAPEIGEANYALALSTVLADFNRREAALPMISRSLAADPTNPLASVVSVFASPQMSQLRSDGALYLTPEGADRLKAAAQAVQGFSGARNGRFVAAFLNSAESTGDSRFPARIGNFSRVIGQNGKLKLPQWSEELVFGQMFTVTVAPARFAPYEPRLVARLQDGLNSLQSNQSTITKIRARLAQLRTQLASDNPTERLVALANFDKLMGELDDYIVQNETQISQVKVIIDNMAVDEQIAKKKEELKQEQAKLEDIKKQSSSIQATLASAKNTLAATEKDRLQKVAELNNAQKRLNALQGQLAQAESRLSERSQVASVAEQTVKDRGDELAALKAREETLKQQQAAAAQLEALKQQQVAADDQLAKLRAEVKAAEQSRTSNLETLKKQQAELENALPSLKAQVEAGEKGRLEAEKTRQELAGLQGRKSALEGEMKGEQAKLDQIRRERDQLESQVQAMREQQNREMAKKADVASRLGEVDFGKYYAIIIGNNDYKEWPKLRTAVADARSIGDTLEKKYGFKVKILQNATRGQILNAFEDYIDELGPRDNLLVYYAGHGIVDKGFGYWVPVDADAYTSGKTLRTQNMVKHEDVISAIQKLKAKQVMVIADSCFSGGLTNAVGVAQGQDQQAVQQVAVAAPSRGTRTGGGFRIIDDNTVTAVQGTVVQGDLPEELIAMGHWASKSARVVLTSGGNEPVVDQLKSTDVHSIFTVALLDALKNNKGLMKSIELTTAVQDKVIGGIRKAAGATTRGGDAVVPQTPSSNNILGYNGEFLFVARN